MQLIGTLAAGVVGAENGYATILVRGTTKRARCFRDFEGLEAVDLADVQLDQNGGTVIYTNITVDVLVYGENDQLIRRWIESSTAACVEVISPSFTGADYETGVGGPNKPTTLASVFDRLLTSFGAEDFLVKLPDGSEVTLEAALSSLLPPLYHNVKSPAYGATGLGVGNDRPAIQAAIDAAYLAGGGTVFFPAGTYLLDGVSLNVPGGVSLIGSGAAASKLVSPSIVETVINIPASPAIVIPPLPVGSPVGQTIQGLSFSHTVPAGKTTLFIKNGYRVTVKSCWFAVRSTEAILTEAGVALGLDDCDFDITGAGAAIVTGSGLHEARTDVRRCRFVMRATATVVLGIVRGAGLHLLGCVYDGSLAGVSNAIVVSAVGSTGTYGSVRCCEFIDAVARPIVCMALGAIGLATDWFTEDGNFLTGLNSGSRLYSGTYGANVGYYCRLGTREARITTLVTSAVAISILITDQHGIYSIRYTGAANFSIDLSANAPLGARARLLVVNGDAVSRTLTFGAGVRGGTFVLGAGKMIGLELVRAVVNNGISNFSLWFVVGTSGILTTGTDSGYPV